MMNSTKKILSLVLILLFVVVAAAQTQITTDLTRCVSSGQIPYWDGTAGRFNCDTGFSYNASTDELTVGAIVTTGAGYNNFPSQSDSTTTGDFWRNGNDFKFRDAAATRVITTNDGTYSLSNKDLTATSNTLPAEWGFAVTDETTAITTGTAKVTFRMPFAMTLTGVRCNVNTVSSSGNPAIDINEAGASIFSTTLTIDASEKTSVTAATPAVISDSSLADDSEITVDIDTAGTGAKGLKCLLIGTR